MPLVSAVVPQQEYEDFKSVPGANDGQRLRWLCRFWSAVQGEKHIRDAQTKHDESRAERSKIHAVTEDEASGPFRGKVEIASDGAA